MDKIFEVKERTGRTIYLPRESWKHIVVRHPELVNWIEEIKETLVHPLFINDDLTNDSIKYYHRRYKKREQYVLVIVRYLNGKGIIITSFYTENEKP